MLDLFTKSADLGTNVLGFGYGIYQDQRDSNWRREEAARNQANFDRQFSHSLDQFAYMQTQNQLTRDREDNAIQRRMADMTAAGLHHSLALGGGSGASAQMVSAGPSMTGGNSTPVRSQTHAIQQSLQLNNLLNQNKLLDAQRANIEADTANKIESTAGIGQTNAIRQLELDAQRRLGISRIAMEAAEAEFSQRLRTGQQVLDQARLEQTAAHFQKTYDLDVKKLQNLQSVQQFAEWAKKVQLGLLYDNNSREDIRLKMDQYIMEENSEKWHAQAQMLKRELRAIDENLLLKARQLGLNEDKMLLDVSKEIMKDLTRLIISVR